MATTYMAIHGVACERTEAGRYIVRRNGHMAVVTRSCSGWLLKIDHHTPVAHRRLLRDALHDAVSMLANQARANRCDPHDVE